MEVVFHTPETYRNCCKIPHWICSIIICVIFFVVSICVFFMSIFASNIVGTIYEVGGSSFTASVCGVFISSLLIVANCFLAYGIAKDWALFFLIWLIISFILWNLHMVLFLISFILFYIAKRKQETIDFICVISIFLLQALWLALLIMIGSHWYAICEEIFTQEYGVQPPGLNRRLYTVSNRRRTISHVSERIPELLHRIER